MYLLVDYRVHCQNKVIRYKSSNRIKKVFSVQNKIKDFNGLTDTYS